MPTAVAETEMLVVKPLAVEPVTAVSPDVFAKVQLSTALLAVSVTVAVASVGEVVKSVSLQLTGTQETEKGEIPEIDTESTVMLRYHLLLLLR